MPEETPKPRDIRAFAREVMRAQAQAKTAPDGSPIPEDPFKTVSLPGVEGGARLGTAIGERLRRVVPPGLRDAGSQLIAGYGAVAAPAPPEAPGWFTQHVSAPVIDIGNHLEQKAREWSPQYKYDRSLQEYARLMEKAERAVRDEGELD